ncbi:MAG: transglutaminase-like domain-containing protein [Bacteroidota bacterium]
MEELEPSKADKKTTSYLDFNNIRVQQFIQANDINGSDRDRAVHFYYVVRDHFIYDPYHLDLRPEALKASVILNKKRAWCVEKSIVLAACLRAIGIPARLGYGIVINHVGVERLKKFLQRDEIVFHGYVQAWIDDKWVKTTPAFDKNVCRLSGVPSLEWDGRSDAMMQAYVKNEKFMEYTHFYGEFQDVPIDLMNAEMKKFYPHLFEEVYDNKTFSFFHT